MSPTATGLLRVGALAMPGWKVPAGGAVLLTDTLATTADGRPFLFVPPWT